jgi:hypothetical protein
MNEQQNILLKKLGESIPLDMPLIDVLTALNYTTAFICEKMGMDETNLEKFQSALSLSLAAFLKIHKDLTD